jgi:hypothetical protein
LLSFFLFFLLNLFTSEKREVTSNARNMMLPQIRCNHHSDSSQPFTFFVLSKGDHAGKPAFNPWVNAFSVRCNNQESFDFYFWLIFGLHQAGKFKTRHRGYEIPFINLQDVRDILREVTPAVYDNWHQFKRILSILEDLEHRKARLGEILVATRELQCFLIDRLIVK